MTRSTLLIPAILFAVSIAAQPGTDQSLLDSVQFIANGKAYSVEAHGVKNDDNPMFASNVVINLYELPLMQQIASFALRDAEMPWGVTLEAVHIEPGDDQQFAVLIYSGGNDIVASCSARYYSIKAAAVTELIYVDWGDPQASDIDGDGVQEIVTQAEYWGQFLSHAECIAYLDAIYGWDGSKIVKSTAKYKKFIRLEEGAFAQFDETRAHIQVQGKSYDGLRDDERQDLFRAAVSVLLAYRDSWLRDDATKWWQANAGFLSQILDVEHYSEIVLELEPGKGRLWNGEDYTLVR